MCTNLRDKTNEDDHTHTGDNVCMVLDDKLVAENRRPFLVVWSSQHSDPALVIKPKQISKQNSPHQWRNHRILNNAQLLLDLCLGILKLHLRVQSL